MFCMVLFFQLLNKIKNIYPAKKKDNFKYLAFVTLLIKNLI
jgi:hypothetical protein